MALSLLDGVVRIEATIDNLAPGRHGFSILEHGDCALVGGSAEHFNPTRSSHGHPDSPQSHAGDLGNIHANALGHAVLSMVSRRLSLSPGPLDVAGRAIVVWERADDFREDADGIGGGAAACGVIEVVGRAMAPRPGPDPSMLVAESTLRMAESALREIESREALPSDTTLLDSVIARLEELSQVTGSADADALLRRALEARRAAEAASLRELDEMEARLASIGVDEHSSGTERLAELRAELLEMRNGPEALETRRLELLSKCDRMLEVEASLDELEKTVHGVESGSFQLPDRTAEIQQCAQRLQALDSTERARLLLARIESIWYEESQWWTVYRNDAPYEIEIGWNYVERGRKGEDWTRVLDYEVRRRIQPATGRSEITWDGLPAKLRRKMEKAPRRYRIVRQ